MLIFKKKLLYKVYILIIVQSVFYIHLCLSIEHEDAYNQLKIYIETIHDIKLDDKDKPLIMNFMSKIKFNAIESLYEELKLNDFKYEETALSETYCASVNYMNDIRTPGVKIADFLLSLIYSI